MKKKFDISLIEHGLTQNVFTPKAVLDLLYTPLVLTGFTHPKPRKFSALTWSVNKFTEIPLSAREKLIKACFIADKEETALQLNRRFGCVIYSLLCEQNDIMKDADRFQAVFDNILPATVMEEIYHWHKYGLEMDTTKHYLLERIFNNLLQEEGINPSADQLPVWVNEKKRRFKKLLSLNKTKMQRRVLKMTLTKCFIQSLLEDSPSDDKELNTFKKEAQKIENSIKQLVKERRALELKLAELEIYRILEEDFPLPKD